MAQSWADRFRAARWDQPDYARDRPDRAILLGNQTGTWEVYSWAGDGAPRLATTRPNGTNHAVMAPDGDQLYWFADHDGDEFGRWLRQPFGSPPGTATEPLAGVPEAYPSGFALGRSGRAVVGRADPTGATIHLVDADGSGQVIYHHRESATVADLSRDEQLVLMSHSEHGDTRHPAVRVLDTGGAVRADLWDGPGRGLDPVGFAPDGASALLVHERRDRRELAIWEPATGAVRELPLDLPGELAGEFYPDGSALLVLAAHEARTTAWRHELATGSTVRIGPPTGTVQYARPRPDGGAWLVWSSASEPPVVLDAAAARPLLRAPGPPAPPSVPVTDLHVPGPGGPVHTLLSRPVGNPPYPAVFLVHGGPAFQDTDSFQPVAAAWVDAGYAAVRINYRGSTGYGPAWRDALQAAPGLVELDDVAAVHDRLVADGVVDPARCVLAGGSWGGLLTLLGLGRQPDRWACGIAAVPVADFLAAYEDEMEPLKAYDRALFGGSPSEVFERFRDASPLTYVDRVRAPVLVLAGMNDPRCPIRQIENYLQALAARGAEHEVYRYDAGHSSLVVEERIRQTRAKLEFATRHVPPDRPGSVV